MRPTLLPVLTLLLLAPAPALAQDRDQLREEIDRLRKELTRKDDEALEIARRYDQERKRWQDEKEELLEEMTRIAKEAAKGTAKVEAKAPPKAEGEEVLDQKRLNVNFPDTPLRDVVDFIAMLAQVKVELNPKVDAEAKVSLRTREITVRTLLDLLALNTKDADGKFVTLEWRWRDGRVQMRPDKKTKSKKKR